MLPRDVQMSVNFALVSIEEPKTRLTAARRQVAKLDIPDLLEVVDMAFGDLDSRLKLWPSSGQTLRNRLRQILQALSLPVVKTLSLKPLDLGSLRSGGATWLISTTAQSDFVMRRGRWLNAKTMSIYLQESMALLYLQQINKTGRDSVFTFASLFRGYLQKALVFRRLQIPATQWYVLLKLERWHSVSVQVGGRIFGSGGTGKMLAAETCSQDVVPDPEGLQKQGRSLSWWSTYPRMPSPCLLKCPRPTSTTRPSSFISWEDVGSRNMQPRRCAGSRGIAKTRPQLELIYIYICMCSMIKYYISTT